MLFAGVVLLVLSIVGGGEFGWGKWKFTVQGKVGVFPRVSLLIASGVCLILSLVTFILVEEDQSSRSPTSPATTPPTSHPSSDSPTSTQTNSTAAVVVESTIKDGAVGEEDDLTLQGFQSVTFNENSAAPTAKYTYQFPPSVVGKRLDFTATVVMQDSAGNTQQFTGSGWILIEDGYVFDIQIDRQNHVILRPAG